MEVTMSAGILSQIAELQRQIEKYEKQIVRLQKASREIQQDQKIAMENKQFIRNPEITSDIWRGNRAERAIDLREYISTEYDGLFMTDVESQLALIEAKIAELREKINELRRQIAYLQQLLIDMQNQQK